MSTKANPPQPEIARDPKNQVTPTIANSFDTASLEQDRLGQRLAEYQEKLTQDYQRAIAAAEWAEARLEALNDLFSDLEYFETDGGVYAVEL